MIPTIFTGPRNIIVYWNILDQKRFPVNLIPRIISYELYDLYLDLIEVLERYYKCDCILGLDLDPCSLDYIKKRHIYLGGKSLGLPWLIGFWAHKEKIHLPSNWLGWGAIMPTRNGTFELRSTAYTEQKINVARQRNAKTIFVHEKEDITDFSGRVVRIGDHFDSQFDKIKRGLRETKS